MHGLSERPRELRWYHAAGLLFGDWGTSRLYVLGIAFVASGHASFWYVAAMCALVTVVGFSYTIVCSHFPDGGGVYSAAKKRSATLAVLGALLLIANYIITAALSAYVGFRYILPAAPEIALYAAVASLVLLGGINIVGPRRVGLLAIVIALLSAAFYLVLGLISLPHIQHAVVEQPAGTIMSQWTNFTHVILALSGVEAIANMTGVMAEPVGKNSRKAIFVVLAEVVMLNLILAYVMNASPSLMNLDIASLDEAQRKNLEDHMLKILSAEFVGPWFANVSSVFFGLLLLSAANTAIGGMVSVQYLLARDKELPDAFTRLNSFGVPWVGLIVATVLPAIVLLIVGPSSATLAGLYAIGVVGAICINLLACGTNFQLTLKEWERVTLLMVGAFTALIWISIALQRLDALMFALLIVATGFGTRHLARRRPPVVTPEPDVAQAAYESGVKSTIAANMPRLLVPTRGHPKLLKFAISYAKDKHAAVFVLFIREIALAFRERGGKIGAETMTLSNDKEAQEIFARVKKQCEEAGVPMVPLYAVHDSPAELILDHAATLGVDAVLMGVSQRNALWKTLRGDVLQEVINYLPESIPLLIHA